MKTTVKEAQSIAEAVALVEMTEFDNPDLKAREPRQARRGSCGRS